MTSNNSSSSSEDASNGMQTACSGVVLPAAKLPAGIVSLQQLPGHASSSSMIKAGPGACTACSWNMPSDMMRQKLLQLEAAAADADSACSIMAAHQDAPQQLQQQQQQQQNALTKVQQVVKLFERATVVRQLHLAPANQLLGESHHLTAFAAVQSAILAAALAGVEPQKSLDGNMQDGSSELQCSLMLLQDSLAMQTEAEVCTLLLKLQDALQDVLLAPALRVPACTCAACQQRGLDTPLSLAAVLQLPCSVGGQSEKQCLQPQQKHEGVSTMLQESLLVAARHFSRSVEVLAFVQPPDALALAAEKAACCAACFALLAATNCTGSCCRCSEVSNAAAGMLQEVVQVVQLLLGSC